MFHTNHKMPIVFFTQLMGVAFGLEPKKVGVGREYTNASKALVTALKAAPAGGARGRRSSARRARPRPDKRALPMPRMADSEVEE